MPFSSHKIRGVKLFYPRIFCKGFEIGLKCFESYREGETNTASFFLPDKENAAYFMLCPANHLRMYPPPPGVLITNISSLRILD